MGKIKKRRRKKREDMTHLPILKMVPGTNKRYFGICHSSWVEADLIHTSGGGRKKGGGWGGGGVIEEAWLK